MQRYADEELAKATPIQKNHADESYPVPLAP